MTKVEFSNPVSDYYNGKEGKACSGGYLNCAKIVSFLCIICVYVGIGASETLKITIFYTQISEAEEPVNSFKILIKCYLSSPRWTKKLQFLGMLIYMFILV